MGEHGNKLIAAIGVAATVLLGGIAHASGMLDDLWRVVGRVVDDVPPPRIPPAPKLPRDPVIPRIPAANVDALDDPLVDVVVKEAIRLVRVWRRGELDEKAAAKSACAVMNQTIDGERQQDEWEREIRENLLTTYDGPFADAIASRYATKAANAVWIAQRFGGSARWYYQYCIRP